ncbi:hypothetical protein Pgy4_40160, partial [Pseudomonas savastanoi pv. glycinea str. race 4]
GILIMPFYLGHLGAEAYGFFGFFPAIASGNAGAGARRDG